MCEMLIGVPAGNPDRFTTNVAVADVTLPAVSLVVTMVTVTLPVPDASAPTMAGTSFAGNSVAVNVGLVGVVGAVDDELPQADTRTPRVTNKAEKRFIGPTPLRNRGSVEFPGQVEPEVEALRHT